MLFLQEADLLCCNIFVETAKMQKIPKNLHKFQIALEKSTEIEYNSIVLFNIKERNI